MTHKFRIWNGKEYVTKPIYLKCSDGSLYDYERDYGDTFSSNKILSQVSGVVEQWTGLTDKNGKDVYEGDIIEISINIAHQYEWEDRFIEQKCLVTFRDGVFAARWGNKGCNKEYPGDGVVIGNINENPELLEEK